jgi:hypothetical protein
MTESLYGLTMQNFLLMFNFMAIITWRWSQASEIGMKVDHNKEKCECEIIY